MGLTNAKIQIRNPTRPDLAAVEVEALADTGADHMCIPLAVQQQLQLQAVDEKEAELADGSRKWFPYKASGHCMRRRNSSVGRAADS